MARDLNEAWGWIQKLVQRVSRLESGSMLENSSISSGRMRFIGGLLRLDSGARLELVGTADVTGTLTATGTTNLNGPVNIAGNTTATGTANLNGPVNIAGLTTVTGNSDFNGIVNVDGDLGVNGNAYLRGNVRVESGGTITVTGADPAVFGVTSRGPGLGFADGSTISKRSYGLAMAFSDTAYVAVSAVGVALKYGSFSLGINAIGTGVTGPLNVSGAFTAASKSFKIPHPLKDDTWLLHGVTESPVHGVEYWGEEVIGADGSFRVELPDYFEALTLEEGRAVLVTGRGHCPDWSDVDGTHFMVTGEPGKRFSWLVKAARSDVILETEEPVEPVTAP